MDERPASDGGVPSPEDAPTERERALAALLRPRSADPDEEREESPAARAVEAPTDLRFVGPATATVIEAAPFSAADVAHKAVSYQMLVDAGVNPGVAARIRREHSLSWSFESDGRNLERRSSQVRGLGDDERAWVAASSGGWTVEGDDGDATAEAAWVAASRDAGGADGGRAAAEADGSGDPVAAEAAWRERSRPTPVTTLDPVGEAEADLLARAGITSVRSLATADPEHVADVLDLDAPTVREWWEASRAVRE